MQMCLQRVRRVNFWNEVIVRLSPIMDQITRLFLWLRSEGEIYCLRTQMERYLFKKKFIEGNKLQYFSEWQVILTIYFAMGSCNTAMLGPVDCIRRVCEVLLLLYCSI